MLVFIIFSKIDSEPRHGKFNFSVTFSRSQILIISVSSLWGFAHHGLFNFLPNYFEESVETGLGVIVGSGFLTVFVLFLGIIGHLPGGRLGEKYNRRNMYIWVVGLNIPFLIRLIKASLYRFCRYLLLQFFC